ncbi:5-methyltetrahydropteroyltriglutamate--homocysteine S-methyltransferase [Corynebacterium sputi]|uniref:5-methyltetrahydropteroyltriglutamate-- homocysteine S-methyltransferase n=1 Tax=Corynebacterium sputi TaxID=489915 RepID=UPI0003F947E0|nr:5-methyltetrahydropteroyltriglutamate--homocysteine S-methyltransferase [Corynebacterium sputi]
MTTTFTTTVLGTPRIGPNRELKRAVEDFWAGRTGIEAVLEVRNDLRTASRRSLLDAGHDSIPVGTHSLYDHFLDSVALFGGYAPRHRAAAAGSAHPEWTSYFAAARGTASVPPLEMTKWFDTNYHNLVPEFGAHTEFSLHATDLLDEVREAVAEGIPARPVIVGPLTLLLLAKPTQGGFRTLSLLNQLLPLYVELLAKLKAAGAEWVQIDEPILVQDRTVEELSAAERIFTDLAAATDRPSILVATYFEGAHESLNVLAEAPVEGVALDFVAGPVPTSLPAGFGSKLLVAGVVDGRNIWRTDLEAALQTLEGLRDQVGSLAVSTSCSLLHVPYSLAPEKEILEDELLAARLAFGEEKIGEVAALGAAIAGGSLDPQEVALSRAAIDAAQADPRVTVGDVRDRVGKLVDSDSRRPAFAQRFATQSEAHPLPAVPTTTIGSFPQTPQIRVARADLRNGTIDEAEYKARMRAEIDSVIALQEEIGLDVLVHGEPERNDMVQYFAEQLTGYAATVNGWVQSYGSRCVRPPLLFGDVSRPKPMTLEWAQYAQSLTPKPVKGMLTGPVTMLSWAFVRSDIPLPSVADQVALAIRDEVVDLESAGISIVQVDEAALRELLPLREADQRAYLDWSVRSFRLATSGVADVTQIHTHMCYSEFGDLIDAVADLDADVTSIEAARSDMEVIEDLEAIGFELGVGPGIYDIHSPRVPSVSEMADALRLAARRVPGERLWANPDCGLKTRKHEESTPALKNLVEAAKIVRAELAEKVAVTT